MVSSCGSARRRASCAPSHLGALLLLSAAAFGPAPPGALAEIRTFSGPIAASSNYVHYSEGFILAPGYVDLSDLIFAVTDDGGSGYAPAPRGRDDDDEPQPEPEPAPTPADVTPPAEEPTAEVAPPPPSEAPVTAPPSAAPVKTTLAPVTATLAPVAASAAPVAASAAPVAASAAPVAASAAPASATPTGAPAATTGAPVKATGAPVTVAPTSAPASAAPTAAPLKATAAPVKATSAPVTVAPTPAPVAVATEAPVKAAPPPTEAPVKAAPPPTEAPVKAAPPPTEAPVKAAPPPTEAPVAAPKDDAAGDGDGGGRALVGAFNRALEESAVELEEEAEGNDDIPSQSGSSVVDIVFFLQPPECSQSQKGCDWTELGVGESDPDGNLRWCCTDDAAQLGFCDSDRQGGRLIISKKKFTGEHRFVTIPPDGGFSGHVQGGDKFTVKDIDGKYVMVIANCNDMGRDVNVSGTYSWVSKHGYLPGELFGEMYFFAAVTVIYFMIFIWYGSAMQCNKESTIGIQRWILWTISLGLLETFFNAGNYWVWNEDGVRAWYAMYTGVILGVLKRAISRCLVVMVSLGWGVVRDTLGDQLKKIVFLGILYVGVSTACECMKIFAIDQYKTLSLGQEEELFDVVTILTFVVAAVDVTFYMWILDALNGTMQYLENMSQSTKLRQYLRLRCILLLSILFAVIWAVFGIVNSYMDGMLEEEQQWSIQAAWELNYLMVLLGVATLWRPTKNAKEYAYVMELPSMAGDDDDIEFETNADTISDDDDGGLKIDDAIDA